jgi:tetratricopeptide (TPR) repeat protein
MSRYVEVMNVQASLPLEASPAEATPGDRARNASPWRPRIVALMGLACLVIVGLVALFHFATRFDPLGRAHRAYEAHDYRTAFRAAHDHLKRRPDDRRASLLAARCLTGLGQGRQAEDYYKQSVPLDLQDSHDRAWGLVLAGRTEQAVEIYFDMIQRWPEDVLALKRLAGVLMELKAWKPALLVSERLIRIPEGEVAGQTLAGIGFHVSHHAAQAISSFQRVLRLDPDLKEMPLPKPLFWNHLALDLIAMGRTAEARSYLERALGQQDDAGLREILGVTYEKEGSADEAEKCWRQALTLDANNADTLLDLGRLALGRGRFDEAVEFLERAADVSPQSIDPVYNLSRAYRLKGNVAKAQHYERRADQLRRARPSTGGMGEMPDSNDAGRNPATTSPESAR